jgi:hypothetical protein
MATAAQQAEIDKITAIASYADVRRMVQALADRWPEMLLSVMDGGRRVFVGGVNGKPILFAACDRQGECSRSPSPHQFARLMAGMDQITNSAQE